MDLRLWKHRRLFGRGIAVRLKHLVRNSLQRGETPCQLGQASVPGSLPLCAVHDWFRLMGATDGVVFLLFRESRYPGLFTELL